ncbi:hypothetical protein M407DRAFT_27241 [Tulasnella calospora MUT 4182]|uniref:F-box domain-containing protein n=1 Tax=Tulasnella calospora MUT 4182 TaxID=1051891 RepID=A0A0C3Q3G9_9AGAM|nr:hypothetical protein M407DRAFT_27241 [Tulasnella calospora MUT 4182]
MATILSLPPEILLQVFEYATDDLEVLNHTPSWKHYDLSLIRAQSDIPWLAPSRESEDTAITLGMVCRYWRPLAVGLGLRHVRVQHALQLRKTLDRLSGTPDAGKSVKWITLGLPYTDYRENLWNEGDTGQLAGLLKLCPNLEVFAMDMAQARGEIILQSLASFCGKLKRLHWRGGRAFDVSVSEWTSALPPFSFIEALEIDSEAEGTAETSENFPPPLCLPSLKHFRLSALADTPRDLLDGVSTWALPSLTNLYLAAPDIPCDELPNLFLAFHGSLKSLSLDANTSLKFDMNLLAQTSLEQLGIYNVVGFACRPSKPLPSISTVVIRLFVERDDRTLISVCRPIRTVAWISKENFAQLDQVVIIGSPIEDLDEPCQVAKLGQFEAAGLACERWDKQGVRVVNRRGIRVLRLITNDVPHTRA